MPYTFHRKANDLPATLKWYHVDLETQLGSFKFDTEEVSNKLAELSSRYSLPEEITHQIIEITVDTLKKHEAQINGILEMLRTVQKFMQQVDRSGLVDGAGQLLELVKK